MKEQKIEEAWNKKRLIITGIIALFLIAAVVYYTGSYKIGGNSAKESEAKIQQSVKGAVENIDAPGVREIVEDKIEKIKTEASNIDVIEIASSSPQVQKIINDIKSLEKYPSDQAKSMCESICDSF